MSKPSLDQHRDLLNRILADDQCYSVARIRRMAMLRGYPAVVQLTKALIWHYRINDLLDEVDETQFIHGRRYPAWRGQRWKALPTQAVTPQVQLHWLLRLLRAVA